MCIFPHPLAKRAQHYIQTALVAPRQREAKKEEKAQRAETALAEEDRAERTSKCSAEQAQNGPEQTQNGSESARKGDQAGSGVGRSAAAAAAAACSAAIEGEGIDLDSDEVLFVCVYQRLIYRRDFRIDI